MWILLTLLAAQPTQEPTAPAEILVWSGATTRTAAEKQQEALVPLAKALDPFMVLAPRVVESKTVQGLNPGFFIVALGACDAKQAASARALFQALRPAVYAKAVSLTAAQRAALACPAFGVVDAADAVDEVRWSVASTAHVDAPGKRTLAGVVFRYEWDQQGDFAQRFFESRAVFVLVDAAGAVLDAAVPEGHGDAATGSLATKGAALVFDAAYADPRCDPSGDHFAKWTQTVTATASAAAIRVKSEDPRKQEEGACGYAEERKLYEGPP